MIVFDDADVVASGSDDQTVRLWRLSSQLKSSRFTTPPSLAKAEPNVRAIEAQSAGPVPHPAALAEGTALGEAELVAAQSGDGSKGPAAAAEPSAAVRAKVGAAGPSGTLGKGPAALYGAASKAKKGKSLLPQLSQLVVSSNLEAVQRNVQVRNSCRRGTATRTSARAAHRHRLRLRASSHAMRAPSQRFCGQSPSHSTPRRRCCGAGARHDVGAVVRLGCREAASVSSERHAPRTLPR